MGDQFDLFSRRPDPSASGPAAPARRPAYMERSAVLSPCGVYRYRLTRRWGDAPKALFVMLNPSTADADVDDPTVRRCEGFARAWGHGGFVVVNLFAWRATDPAELCREHAAGADVVGPENDAHVAAAASGDACSIVVAAWGARGRLGDRDFAVQRLLASCGRRLTALRLTKSGSPEHPLYLPADLKPSAYEVPTR